jgi:hypothetical protein
MAMRTLLASANGAPLTGPATVTVQAHRIDPPPPLRYTNATTAPAPVDGDCASWRPLLERHGIPYTWAVDIMRRESGCRNVHTYRPSTRDDSYGPFQVNRWGSLDAAWTAAGFPRDYMATPEGAIAAAAVLYDACGAGPWTRPYTCPGGWPL